MKKQKQKQKHNHQHANLPIDYLFQSTTQSHKAISCWLRKVTNMCMFVLPTIDVDMLFGELTQSLT